MTSSRKLYQYWGLFVCGDQSIFGQPFVKLVALCYRTVVCPVYLSVLSVTLVYCGQTVGWIKIESWHGGRPRPRPHCVRWGPNSPQRGTAAFQFSARDCCSQMAGWIKMPLGMEVELGPGHIVLDRDPSAPSWSIAFVYLAAPSFRPVFIVTKRSPISATADILLHDIIKDRDIECLDCNWQWMLWHRCLEMVFACTLGL